MRSIMTFSLFSSILLIGAVQGIFLALALVTLPKGARRANIFLATFIFAYSAELLYRFIVTTGIIYSAIYTIPFYWALDVCFGPLLYLYTREITNFTRLTQKDRYQHLLLPVAAMAAAALFGLFHSNNNLLSTLTGNAAALLRAEQVIFAALGLVSMFFYLVKCLLVLREHQQRVTENFSYHEKVCLNWLRNLISLLGILLLLYTTIGLYNSGNEMLDNLYPIALVLVVFLIGFIGIRQSVVFVEQPAERVSSESSEPNKPDVDSAKYEKSALSSGDTKLIYRAVVELVEQEELFLQNDLSLPRLAKLLDLPSHYISQAINQESGSHFFDFINHRRVEYVSNILISPQSDGISILTLAMDAGFNSKSAFYSAFKAQTGLTPLQYKKSHQK